MSNQDKIEPINHLYLRADFLQSKATAEFIEALRVLQEFEEYLDKNGYIIVKGIHK